MNFSFIKKYLNYDIILIFLLSLIFSAIFNLQYYLVILGAETLFIFMKFFLLSFLYSFTSFLLFFVFRSLFIPISFLFILISSIAAYYSIKYNISISPDIMSLVAETSFDEASGLINIYSVISVLFMCIPCIAALFYIRIKAIKTSPNLKAVLFLVSLIVFIFDYSSYTENRKQYKYEYLPYNVFFGSYKYYQYNKIIEKKIEKKKEFQYKDFKTTEKNMNVIFIIGEAARYDHFHINGYSRKTSPMIEKNNMLSFPNLYSFYTLTKQAIPVMLKKDRLVKNKYKPGFSFIEAFNRSGFRTSWISNQGSFGFFDNRVTILAKEAKNVHYNNLSGDYKRININDGQLLPVIKDSIRKGGNNLIVVHTIGSHWKYDLHYPENFQKYKPICGEGLVPEELGKTKVINSYDNSILYTDYFIGQVIDIVRDLNAVVFFVSDHGEALGEKKRYLHANENAVKEQFRPAMFFWASDKYIKSNPDKYKNIMSNRHSTFYQNILFHTVIDSANIKTENIDPIKSLFNKDFEPYLE